MLTHALSQPCPSSAFSLLMALSLQMCFRGALLTASRSPRFLGSLPSPKARPAPPHLAGAAHTEPASECCVCVRGTWGQAWAFCPVCLWPQQQPRGRNPLQSLFLAFP